MNTTDNLLKKRIDSYKGYSVWSIEKNQPLKTASKYTEKEFSSYEEAEEFALSAHASLLPSEILLIVENHHKSCVKGFPTTNKVKLQNRLFTIIENLRKYKNGEATNLTEQIQMLELFEKELKIL